MTAPVSTLHAHRAATPGLRATLADLAVFLRRPVLPGSATGFSRRSLSATMRLFAIDIAAMTILALIGGALLLTGVEFPQNALEQIDLSPRWIAIIVLGAPLTEELLFRSWLSGQPGHLLAGLLAGGIVLLLPLIILSDRNWVMVAVTVMALAALFSLWRWRARKPVRWFAWAFPAIFWLVALAFGLINTINYEGGSLLAVLPLVIPQFVAGTLFGYARVTYGLWSGMLVHALHNGTAVILMMLAGTALIAG